MVNGLTDRSEVPFQVACPPGLAKEPDCFLRARR
jgi:hypothetical protein